MKQLGNKQWHRKTESLLALLMYRKAQGAVETEPFATLMQQIFSDVIAANPVDANVLKNSMAQFKVGKLPKTKRTRRRFAYSWKLYQQTKKNGTMPIIGRSHGQISILSTCLKNPSVPRK